MLSTIAKSLFAVVHFQTQHARTTWSILAPSWEKTAPWCACRLQQSGVRARNMFLILSMHLGKRKVCTNWISRTLREDESAKLVRLVHFEFLVMKKRGRSIPL